MAIVNIEIKNRIAVAPEDAELVCNNPTDSIRFIFDDEWKAYSAKTARFAWANKHIDVPFIGEIVQVPEITQTISMFVGVFADDLSSTPVEVKCRRSIRCMGGAVPDPEPDVYDQIIGLINTIDPDSGGASGVASPTRLGVVRVGENLKIDKDGVLSVDTATAVEEDNTRPVTSAAVHTELGNIEALLANI